jgi:predicted DNA binding CopG/RHH family protein
VYIRLHPAVLQWAKREAKRRHVGYQTFLSEWLLHGAQAA